MGLSWVAGPLAHCVLGLECASAGHSRPRSITGVSSWEAPEWIDEVDPNSGAVYYVNGVTGETQWDMPFEFIPVRLARHRRARTIIGRVPRIERSKPPPLVCDRLWRTSVLATRDGVVDRPSPHLALARAASLSPGRARGGVLDPPVTVHQAHALTQAQQGTQEFLRFGGAWLTCGGPPAFVRPVRVAVLPSLVVAAR